MVNLVYWYIFLTDPSLLELGSRVGFVQTDEKILSGRGKNVINYQWSG